MFGAEPSIVLLVLLLLLHLSPPNPTPPLAPPRLGQVGQLSTDLSMHHRTSKVTVDLFLEGEGGLGDVDLVYRLSCESFPAQPHHALEKGDEDFRSAFGTRCPPLKEPVGTSAEDPYFGARRAQPSVEASGVGAQVAAAAPGTVLAGGEAVEADFTNVGVRAGCQAEGHDDLILPTRRCDQRRILRVEDVGGHLLCWRERKFGV